MSFRGEQRREIFLDMGYAMCDMGILDCVAALLKLKIWQIWLFMVFANVKEWQSVHYVAFLKSEIGQNSLFTPFPKVEVYKNAGFAVFLICDGRYNVWVMPFPKNEVIK